MSTGSNFEYEAGLGSEAVPLHPRIALWRTFQRSTLVTSVTVK